MLKRILFPLIAVFALAAAPSFAAGPAPAAGSPPTVKGPFVGTVHATADITYRDGSEQSWTWDRGRITALSDTSITLTRRDKQQVSFAITQSTVVRNAGATYQLSDLHTGLAATVISQNGDAVVIRRLRGRSVPGGGDPSAITGPLMKSVTGTVDAQYVDGSQQSFEYDRGLITQASNGQLTIKRADGQSLTLTYDGSTVVRNGHAMSGSTSELAPGEVAMFFSQGGAAKLVAGLHHVRPRRGAATH